MARRARVRTEGWRARRHWIELRERSGYARGVHAARRCGASGAYRLAAHILSDSNPKLIWLAETLDARVPTAVAAQETIRYAGFANGSVGWAVTDRRLLLTDDRGATGRTDGPPVDYASGAPKGASFFDADHG
jgi:hypothetical protein